MLTVLWMALAVLMRMDGPILLIMVATLVATTMSMFGVAQVAAFLARRAGRPAHSADTRQAAQR